MNLIRLAHLLAAIAMVCASPTAFAQNVIYGWESEGTVVAPGLYSISTNSRVITRLPNSPALAGLGDVGLAFDGTWVWLGAQGFLYKLNPADGSLVGDPILISCDGVCGSPPDVTSATYFEGLLYLGTDSGVTRYDATQGTFEFDTDPLGIALGAGAIGAGAETNDALVLCDLPVKRPLTEAERVPCDDTSGVAASNGVMYSMVDGRLRAELRDAPAGSPEPLLLRFLLSSSGPQVEIEFDGLAGYGGESGTPSGTFYALKSDNTIVAVDFASGVETALPTLFDTTDAPQLLYDPSIFDPTAAAALAFDGSNLWLAQRQQLTGGNLLKLSLQEGGTPLMDIPLPGDGFLTGAAFLNGTIYLSLEGNEQTTLLRFDVQTAKFVESLVFPAGYRGVAAVATEERFDEVGKPILSANFVMCSFALPGTRVLLHPSGEVLRSVDDDCDFQRMTAQGDGLVAAVADGTDLVYGFLNRETLGRGHPRRLPELYRSIAGYTAGVVLDTNRFVSIVNGSVVVTDGSGNVVSVTPITGTPGMPTVITITGSDADETVRLDGSMLTNPALAFEINLGDGFDTIELLEGISGATGLPVLTHIFDSETSGSIRGEAVVNYTGIDPIIDNLDVSTRVFSFTGGTETIILNADGDGASGNGYSFIDSDLGESVAFKNPSERVIIDAESGVDVLQIGELDTPLPGTFVEVIVSGYDRFDASGVLLGAPVDDGSADQFTVTPAAYPVSVFGGDPAGTCPGDGLRLDMSAGAVVDAFTNTAGAGTYTFSSGQSPVTFSGMETVGETDLEISVSRSVLYATETLADASGNSLVVSVTNLGDIDANCVTVDFSLTTSDWLEFETVTPEAGSVTATEWTVGTVPAGATLTLEFEGFVAPDFEQSLELTLNAFQDSNALNNSAEVAHSFGFAMPAKAHVNAAKYYERTVDVTTFEALIVGLYQGAPGIEGSVWCRIPGDTIGASWPPAGLTPAALGDFWRPCSNGLPFPLHVNDIEDIDGTLWLSTWGSAGLYRSDDEGQSWQEVRPAGAGNNIVYSVTADAGGGLLYASVNNGLVLRSFNDGLTWQQVESVPGIASHTAWSLTAHPTESGVLNAGTHGAGVFQTTDFGFSWTELASGNADLAAGKAGHVFDLAFTEGASGGGNRYLFAATGTGVWRLDLSDPSTSAAPWTLIGPEVTLDDGSTVVPQVRSLAFIDDGGALADDLVAATWGFGAFRWDAPVSSDTHEALSLRAEELLFVEASLAGTLFVGASDGAATFLSAGGGTATETESQGPELPDGYALRQNYPNPFNPRTTISFDLPATDEVSIQVFDSLGRLVAKLVDGTLEAGTHEVTFNAGEIPGGTYFYQLATSQGTMTRALVLLK